MKLNKIILRCVVFVLILIILLEICSVITLPKDNTEKAGVPYLETTAIGVFAEKKNSIDVYFMGDSEAYSAYIPMDGWGDYGFTAYAHGVPSQPLIDCYYDFIKVMKNQNPKVVMLETDSIYQWYSKSRPLAETLYKILPVIEYHNRWKTLNSDDFKFEFKNTYVDDSKGLFLSKSIKQVKTDYQENFMQKNKGTTKIKNLNKICLKLIKQYCDSHDIELILVTAPNSGNWNYKKHNGIQQWADSNNVKYIDMNLLTKEIGLDWNTDARDVKGHHINYFGAKKVTTYLNKYLKENYDLPDHRGDINYDNWAKSYENFQTAVQNEK